MKTNKFKRASFSFLPFVLIGLFLAFQVEAHTRLKGQFVPRSTNDAIKNVPPATPVPCGTDAHTTPVVFQAGQTVTVQWEETIQHTGSFMFFFATANDAPLFLDNPLTAPTPIKVVPDDQDTPITTATGPHQFQTQITLPNTPCDNCTLQLVQIMLDNHPTAPTYYHSCADVKLTAALPTPTPTPGSTPTPTSTPLECPIPGA